MIDPRIDVGTAWAIFISCGADWIKFEVNNCDNKPRDSAAAFLVAVLFDSRNDHAVFHTLPSSAAHASASVTLYASIALPKTWTHAGDSVASALEGGEERTALRTAGISLVI